MAQRRPDRVLGGVHDEFWAWCEKGELRIQRCQPCGKLFWPARATCEHCGGGQFVWERMSGAGKVVSWCSFEYDYYRGLLPLPYDAILVELEEGVLFISDPQGFGWREIEPQMPVKLGFLDCEDSAGPFRLPVFER